MSAVFFGLLGLGVFILGPVAFFLTLGARTRLDYAERKVKAQEARIADLERLTTQLMQRAAPQPQAAETVAAAAPEVEAPEVEEPTRTSPVPSTPFPPAARPLPEPPPLPHAEPLQPPPALALPGGSLPAREDAETVAPLSGAAEETSTQAAVPARSAPDETISQSAPEGISDIQPPPAEVPVVKKPAASLEERLGARWTVWVGGLALALGGLMLVRYAAEAGMFGPGFRIAAGLLLAAALIGAGEFLRRREIASALATGEDLPDPTAAGFARPSIPAMLTAAGTIAAFGAVYAAYALYHFIGPGFAFFALGATGVATMAAAGVHGPMLAGLGLAGAMGSPLLISSPTPTPWPIAIYLSVVALAAHMLARLKSWTWLSQAAAVIAGVWCWLLVVQALRLDGGDYARGALVHLVVQAALALYFLAYHPYADRDDSAVQVEKEPAVAVAAVAALTAFVLLLLGQKAFGLPWMGAALAVAAMLAASACFSAFTVAGAAGAGLLVLFALCIWPAPDGAFPARHFIEAFAFPLTPPLDTAQFVLFALAGGAIAAVPAALRVLSRPALQMWPSALYNGAAGLTPFLLLILCYLRLMGGAQSWTFTSVALALAALYAIAAAIFRSRAPTGEPAAVHLGLGAFASGAISCVALALTFALEGGQLTVAFALAALGAAYVSARLDIAALRWCVAAFAVVVAGRYLGHPRIGVMPGGTPVFNWLLFGYGVPAAAFGGAAWIMRRARGEDAPVRVATMLSIMCAALLAFFEIRHLLNDGDIFARKTGHIELGLHALMSIGFSLVLMQFDRRQPASVYRIGSIGFNLVSAAVAVLGLSLAYNPLLAVWREYILGGSVFNSLILAYLVPAIAYAAAVWWMVRNGFEDIRRHIACGLGILLGAIYILGQARLLLTRGDLNWIAFPHWEIGVYIALAALIALAIWRMSLWKVSPVIDMGGRFFGLLAAGLVLWLLVLFRNPMLPISFQTVGGGSLINSLLPAFLLPAAAFGLATFVLRRFGEKHWLTAAGFAGLCAALYVHNEVHHLMSAPGRSIFDAGHAEFGVHALIEMAFALAVLQFAVRREPAAGTAADMFAAFGCAIAISGAGLLANPLIAFGEPVQGGALFNSLIPAFLLPGLGAFLLGRLADGVRPRGVVNGLRVAAVALVFAYLTAQVRRIYQGPEIGLNRLTGDTEFYTYSAAWLAFGLALLIYGLWRRSVEVRIASALFIVLSVLKVFLMDLSGLEGVLRALSFIGLGIVLIGIGLIYQKFVFVRKPAPQGEAAA